jgi:hypothetical protein
MRQNIEEYSGVVKIHDIQDIQDVDQVQRLENLKSSLIKACKKGEGIGG